MYWKAIIVRYGGDHEKRVGIMLENRPKIYILGCLENSGMKKKWRKQMKIKRWLLYNPHSCSYATHYLRKTVWKDTCTVEEIGREEMLYGFDRDIIMKKFPGMTKEWGKKKKRRKR